MKEKRGHPFDRILIAVDAPLRRYDDLETAADFAAHLETHLMALFVEDINLLKLAELPFARELDRSSGVIRPLESTMIARVLQADAAKLRRRLNEQSQKRSISVSMQVVRGHYVEAAMQLAGESDIVFLSDIAGLPYSPAGATASIVGAVTGQKPVWVLFDDSRWARRSLVLASNLSERYGSDLVVVTADDVDGIKLRIQLKKILGADPDSRFKLVSLSDVEAVTFTAQMQGCAILVLPRQSGQIAQRSNPILGKLKCPRILV